MSTTPLDGRPLSNTPRVADLQATDLVPLVRLSEPLQEDQNVHMRADRLQELLGGDGALPPSPSLTLYDTLGAHTDGAATQRLVTEVANRPGNAARIPLKVVSTYADLLALDPLTCCFGTEAVVLLPAPGEAPRYVLKYVDHAFAWNYVCQDGNFDQNNLSDGQWIAVDSPRAALLDYTEYPAGYSFPTGTFVAAYVAGQTTEQIFKRRAPGGPASAPVDGGDPTEWELASLTDAPRPNPASFQELTGDPRDNVALADALEPLATTEYVDAANAELQGEINDLDTRVTATENDTDALDLRVETLEGASNILAAAYTVSGGVATPYASLQALIVAQGARAAQDARVGLNAPSGQTITGSGALLMNLTCDSATPKEIDIASGAALQVANISGFYVTGDGTLKVTLISSPGFPQYLERGEAAKVEFGGNTASTPGYVILNDKKIAAWTNPAGFPVTVEVDGSSTIPAAPYPAGVTVIDKSNVTHDQLAAPPDTLAYAASIALDFAASPRHTLNATGNVAFTTTGRTTAGAEKTVFVKNAAATSITLAYSEAWKVPKGQPLPTALAAGEELILTLTCLGTSVSDVKAAGVIFA